MPYGSKTIYKSSLNSFVYWDTLYNNFIINKLRFLIYATCYDDLFILT